MINVITETDNGMKLPTTIAKADALPTATWLGSIKKYIAAAANIAPKVMIPKSITSLPSSFFSIFLSPFDNGIIDF